MHGTDDERRSGRGRAARLGTPDGAAARTRHADSAWAAVPGDPGVVDGSAVTGSDAVLVVGPAEIVGGRAVGTELATAAFEFIDDALALVDERVLPIDAAWREVMAAAVHPGARTVVLVCPSWWQ